MQTEKHLFRSSQTIEEFLPRKDEDCHIEKPLHLCYNECIIQTNEV